MVLLTYLIFPGLRGPLTEQGQHNAEIVRTHRIGAADNFKLVRAIKNLEGPKGIPRKGIEHPENTLEIP